MRPGRMDRRVTLQRRVMAENAYGEQVEAWTDLCTVWAEMVPLRGVERFAAQQTAASSDTKWRIRYLTGLTPVDRLVHAGRVHDVTAMMEIGRKMGLEIHTTAGAD